MDEIINLFNAVASNDGLVLLILLGSIAFALLAAWISEMIDGCQCGSSGVSMSMPASSPPRPSSSRTTTQSYSSPRTTDGYSSPKTTQNNSPPSTSSILNPVHRKMVEDYLRNMNRPSKDNNALAKQSPKQPPVILNLPQDLSKPQTILKFPQGTQLDAPLSLEYIPPDIYKLVYGDSLSISIKAQNSGQNLPHPPEKKTIPLLPMDYPPLNQGGVRRPITFDENGNIIE